MQIKTTVSYQPIPVRIAIIFSRRQQITSVGEDMEKRERLYTVGGNVKGAVTIEHRMEIPQKLKKQGFPGGRVVGTLCFHCRGKGSIPWLGNEDSACHAVWPKK